MAEDHTPATGAAHLQPIPARRSTAAEIASAIDLGWRVAALYTLSPTTLTAPSAVTDDMLLNRRSLSASDRVELEVRAIAGVAERVGVALDGPALASLLDLAAGAGMSAAGEQAFREELARRHIAFEKRLWAADEPSGKAYELGNFLSETWNRVLRPRVSADAHGELLEIFSPVRVERMKLLLDDLQARVDPVAAHAVNSHLGDWRDGVRDAPFEAVRTAAATLTPEQVVQQLEPVERQTIIWRQMLTGDKEPEAYLDHAKRSEVRDEFTQQLLKRYRKRLTWLLPLVAALGVAGSLLYAGNEDIVRGLLATVLAVLGTVGITTASMIASARKSLQRWGDLMWNRALAAVICRETLLLRELLLPPVAKPARAK